MHVRGKKKKQESSKKDQSLGSPLTRGPGAAQISDEDDHSVSSAGQPPKSPLSLGPIHLEEFNETLHERIVEALGHQKVIDTITKTVTKAILDTVDATSIPIIRP